MRRNMIRGSLAAAAALALLAACTTDIDESDDTGNGDDGTVEEGTTDTDTDEDADIDEDADTEGDTDAGDDSEWFDQAVYEEQREQLGASFEGDPDTPWLQYIDGPMTDTSEYATDEAQKVCFANASVGNPWRQTGWLTMQQQLEVLEGEGVISEMETRDASDNDDTQIADIDYFISEADCDAFIISPNSTAAMTRRWSVPARPASRWSSSTAASKPIAPPPSSTRWVATAGASTPRSSWWRTSTRATA